jgi:hypothetical protein
MKSSLQHFIVIVIDEELCPFLAITIKENEQSRAFSDFQSSKREIVTLNYTTTIVDSNPQR